MSARRRTWRAIGNSVIGLTHERDGRSCQDAIRLDDSTPGMVVAAIADGHGQAKSFRSQQGADIAVSVAGEVLVRFAQSEAGDSCDAFRARRDLAGHLPRVVAQTWREQVLEHVERHSFSTDELKLLDNRIAVDSAPRISPDAYRALWRAYGTTLLAVLVTGPYALAMQIGDGLLMAAGASGDAFEVLDPDALNFGNSTTSLSDEDAELRLRWRLIPHEGDFPMLYWLCTDGYEKAFRSDDLAGVCLEYRDAFQKRGGWRVIEQNLAAGLRQASVKGTGDDATAAFLFFEEEDDEATAEQGVAFPITQAGYEGCPNGYDRKYSSDGGVSSDSDAMANDSSALANARVPSRVCGEGEAVVDHDRTGIPMKDTKVRGPDADCGGGAP